MSEDLEDLNINYVVDDQLDDNAPAVDADEGSDDHLDGMEVACLIEDEIVVTT